MTETHIRVFRHRLQFERQYAQFVHHPRNTVGHHSKILSTHQHSCRLHQKRQFLHCLTIPELVVATVVIVVVQFVEQELVTIEKRLIDEIELHRDTRVESHPYGRARRAHR